MFAIGQSAFFATLLIVSLFTTGTNSLLYWNQTLPNSFLKPSPRQYGSLAWTATALYLFGGQAEDGALSDTWSFSLNKYTWEELTHVDKPSARYGFISGVINGYWYVVQGRDDNQVLSDVWAFDLKAQTWHQMNVTGEEVPVPRYFAAGGSNSAIVSSNDTAGVIWMSMGISNGDRKLSDIWTLTVNFSTPLEGTWTKLSDGVGLNQYNPISPHARSNVAGMPFGNGQFVINGGCASGGQVGGHCPLEDSWIYSSFSNTWSRLSSCSVPVHSASLVPFNMHFPELGLLYGGTQKGPNVIDQVISGTPPQSNEISLINITSLQWIKIRLDDSVSVPTLRGGAQITLGAVGVFMFGGKNSSNGDLLNDLWLLQGTGANATLVSCSSNWFTFLHLHGILMYIAWGVLLPFGVLIARYSKFIKVKRVCIGIHIASQIGGFLFTCSGIVIIALVSSKPSFSHGVIGIVLTATLIQQLLSGFIRPCKFKASKNVNKESFKYKWRQCWEVYHRVSGIVAVALGFIQVTLGVLLLNSPPVVWGVWVGLLFLWLLVFVVLEIATQFCIKSKRKLIIN